MREAVRDELAADAALVALLPGGIYPTTAYPISELTVDVTPAFGEYNRIKLTALVSPVRTVYQGPTINHSDAFFEVYVWQADGRDQLDAAQDAIRKRLNGRRFAIPRGWLYELRLVGSGGIRDEPLQAELGWTRWQGKVKWND